MKFYNVIICVVLNVFLLTSQVYASGSPKNNVYNLFVKMQNLGSGSCQLSEKTISQGKLLYSNIPSTLDATGEPFEFIVNGNPVELTLQYKCGAQKTFSVYMKQYLKKGHCHSRIDSKMFNDVDVFETHHVEPGIRSCGSDDMGGASCYLKAGKINWTITH